MSNNNINNIDPFKKFKRFFSEDHNLDKLNEDIKNSDDAKYIYRMLLISQKMNFEYKDIENLKQTDFLEKLLDSYIKFAENRDISNLRQFIESSLNRALTTGALINYYDSN